MGQIETNTNPELTPNVFGAAMNPYPSGAQHQLYQDKLNQLNTALQRVNALEQIIENSREQIIDLKNDKRDMKHGYELTLRDKQSEYQLKVDALNSEIKELTRELGDAQKGSGLNGIVTKAMESENGIEQLLTGGAQLIQSLAQFTGKQAPAADGSSPSYNEMVTKIATFLNQGSPSEQQKVYHLITTLVNSAQKNNPKSPDLEGLIDATIKNLTDGTIRRNTGTDN